MSRPLVFGLCECDNLFTLKAILFAWIEMDSQYQGKLKERVDAHDAPGAFTVSWQTKGKSRCPICMDGTTSVYHPSSRKLVFRRHRWFMERKHKYRKMKRYFDNTVEKDCAPK
jgi:hypothetical protein